MNRAAQTRHRGFTLIEIIIVVLVFSIMAAMAYGGLNSVLRTRVGIEDALSRTAAMQRAYFRLRNDFQNLRTRPIRDAFGDAQPALATDREGRVSFTRGGWRNPLTLPRASLERVSYRLDERRLIRSSWRVLDQAQDSKPVELPVLERVTELRWRFLDADKEWSETWPKDTRNTETPVADQPPPRAVELTLVTEDWGELKFLFEAGPPATNVNFSTTEAGSGTQDGNPISEEESGGPGSEVEQPPPDDNGGTVDPGVEGSVE